MPLRLPSLSLGDPAPSGSVKDAARFFFFIKMKFRRQALAGQSPLGTSLQTSIWSKVGMTDLA